MARISKLIALRHRPSLLRDLCNEIIFSKKYKNEINSFILQSHTYRSSSSGPIKLNKLCCIEDWENEEMRTMMKELNTIHSSGGIHRKDWEWALGLIAMKRYGMLNKKSIALGIGSGREAVLYYLANNIEHVYATDLYSGDSWEEAPSDFPDNPKKYCPVPYNETSLTAMRMDGRKLTFESEKFDVAFSFSSIEHFGGGRHNGALQSLREIERVLRPGGIAVIATEFIINDKEDSQFFNRESLFADIINNLKHLRLVEPLDVTISPATLSTVMDYYPTALFWHKRRDSFKRSHPHILLRKRNILWTSVMLVFKKN